MNKRKIFWVFLGMTGWLVSGGLAKVYAGDMNMPAYEGSAEFQRLKGLAGVWQGSEVKGDKEEKIDVEYQVVSNGSAVMEKLFPGTPHEMVTVYYDKKGKPAMTHYCAVGNRPQMDMVSSDETQMKFDLAGSSDIDAAQEAHMHTLTISFIDPDHIEQRWQMYQDGKAGEAVQFKFARVR